MRFTSKTVDQFLDELASSAPVPGGGSGAALAGALAAGLISMVCNLTIGKKGYENAQSDMEQVLARSEQIRARLPDLLQADTEVYGQVMAANRMPRKTPEEKAARDTAMQQALGAAAQVPMQIAALCSELVDLALPAAQKGNKWAVSDAGVGALLAEASMRGALLNVEINLASIQDEKLVRQLRAEMAKIVAGKAKVRQQVTDTVMKAIQG
jgi:formiminotetrahydrofolate cyclodeaminase